MRKSVMLLLGLLLASSSSAARATDSAGQFDGSRAFTQDEQAARVRAGLKALPNGPTSVDNEYGYQLTADELGLLHRADRDVGRGSQFVAEHADDSEFGGAWYDRRNNETVVALTRNNSEIRESAAAAGFEGPLRYLEVSLSYRQLRALQDDVTSSAVRTQIDFASIGYSLPDNAVIVTTPDPAPVRVALVGFDNVIVRQGQKFEDRACGVRSDCGPSWKAGLRIDRTGAGCSAGFIIRGVPNRGLVWTTAGHCGTTQQTTWWHGTTANTVGTMYVRYMASGGKTDVGIIDITDSKASDDIYKNLAIVFDTAIYQQYGLDYYGEAVCVTGISDQKCGYVYNLGITVQKTDGTILYDQYTMDLPIGGGTSGAPAYRNYPSATMMGMFWGGVGNISVWTHQQSIVEKVGGEVYVTP